MDQPARGTPVDQLQQHHQLRIRNGAIRTLLRRRRHQSALRSLPPRYLRRFPAVVPAPPKGTQPSSGRATIYTALVWRDRPHHPQLRARALRPLKARSVPSVAIETITAKIKTGRQDEKCLRPCASKAVAMQKVWITPRSGSENAADDGPTWHRRLGNHHRRRLPHRSAAVEAASVLAIRTTRAATRILPTEPTAPSTVGMYPTAHDRFGHHH